MFTTVRGSAFPPVFTPEQCAPEEPLASVTLGRPDAPKTAFVLHGLFSGKETMRPFVSRMLKDHEEALQDWQFVLVDSPNHGQSPRRSAPFTADRFARDVCGLAMSQGRTMDALIGHSHGGGVALAALRAPWNPVLSPRGLSVMALDSAVGTFDPEADTCDVAISKIMSFVDSVSKSATFPSPGQMFHSALDAGFPRATARWLSWLVVEVSPEPARRFGWRSCPSTARAFLADYARTDLWDVVLAPPAHANVELVTAAASPRWSDPSNARRVAQVAASASPATRITKLDGAGHWVHAERPKQLAAIIAGNLSRASPLQPQAPVGGSVPASLFSVL